MKNNFTLKLLAEKLTLRRPSYDIAKLNQSLNTSIIDLNPHQIEAAVFAFKSPLSKGAILCDEVGLGKTIEAGLIINQLISEGKKHILIICPASIRTQWRSELLEKFGIVATIIDAKVLKIKNELRSLNPFQNEGVIISSIPFAYRHIREIKQTFWDLVVIDEGHRLRNLKSKQHIALKEFVWEKAKGRIILTATPLQNNLLELYGLIQFIDPKLLGSEYSFRENFMADAQGRVLKNKEELRSRINTLSIRTLRRQVQEYVRFTKRHSILQDFIPYPEEWELYQKVSGYLQRSRLAAIEHHQRALMILIYRKILASSSFAIAQTLEKLITNLENKLKKQQVKTEEAFEEELESFTEEVEELGSTDETNQAEEIIPEFSEEEIEKEIEELKSYRDLAKSITKNAKGEALLVALRNIFLEAKKKNWPEKAVIYTESRRTQQYFLELLEENGYKGQIVCFSGISGGKDARDALIEKFKNEAKIFLSTEAGGEGLNLQFCNVVVNYDLPWNPQRIEQRIGRCHRYGQKLDVTVINFLNRKNAADQRVYELLDQKLKLFDGLFGISDDVLGILESGIDFEKKVLEIYQSCRTEEEINAAFQKLQEELEEQIKAQLTETRIKLLEHFDDEVRAKLKIRDEAVKYELSQLEKELKDLVTSFLDENVKPIEGEYLYQIKKLPTDLMLRVSQNLINKKITFARITPEESREIERMHLAHPLVQEIIREVKSQKVKPVQLKLHYTKGGHRISQLEPYLGEDGWWFVYKLTFEGLEIEDRLVSIILLEKAGDLIPLPTDLSRHFYGITTEVVGLTEEPDITIKNLVEKRLAQVQKELEQELNIKNEQYYEQERDKLDTFTEESLMQIEDEIKKIRANLQKLRKSKDSAETYEERMRIREEIDKLDRELQKKLMKSNEENLKLMKERDKILKSLSEGLKLKVDKNLIAVAKWELI